MVAAHPVKTTTMGNTAREIRMIVLQFSAMPSLRYALFQSMAPLVDLQILSGRQSIKLSAKTLKAKHRLP
jgi:hypothetical protein